MLPSGGRHHKSSYTIHCSKLAKVSHFEYGMHFVEVVILDVLEESINRLLVYYI